MVHFRNFFEDAVAVSVAAVVVVAAVAVVVVVDNVADAVSVVADLILLRVMEANRASEDLFSELFVSIMAHWVRPENGRMSSSLRNLTCLHFVSCSISFDLPSSTLRLFP